MINEGFFKNTKKKWLIEQGLAEADDNKFHIGGGIYVDSEKDKDDPDAKKYNKQGDKFVPVDSDDSGSGDAEKPSVNIFDEPADEPKAQSSNDDDTQIGGPNGLEIDRDEIKDILMKDPEIADILGGDDVYWDDADLVSSKFDDATVATIDPDSPMTIGDLKQAIKDFSEEQGAEQAARDNQEFEPVEDDKDINRMQQGMQQAIGGDDYEDVPDRLELQGKMKADNGETIIVWKDTDDGMLMGVDAEGNVYEDGEKARYGIGVSTAGSVFGADQNRQRKAESVSLVENWQNRIDDLLKDQKGHISKHHPATAFKPIQEGPADDDAKAAKKIERQLQDILWSIDKAESLITKNLSGFGAPGLKHAFYDAVKAGTKKQGSFDIMAAGKVLKKYYK